ncbi:helix-turn-helix domain-containing protein [Weeksellaceae bacterium KMM 9713]|uniref:Helix-turn-helix domain-containing protein n=1 Tax=Profundicola chukchiensis TaxID=2961959 RepID=A0A9X4RXU0_9FLAO|nr:helix-turn-helix domain-containing protein [Profundicola chukchiensis]MDG4947054.1 helix-turn-helix domain-containing protein [Profundicola chukchiensis]
MPHLIQENKKKPMSFNSKNSKIKDKKLKLPSSSDVKLLTYQNIQIDNRSRDSIMSIEAENQILTALEQFERLELYTDKDISMPKLASYCNTNVKYLSYCIKQYKSRNFNHYINDLRVNYVIEKLRKDSDFRKYKFSVLASMAGFSSEKKFSTIFKQITEVPPSEFIKQFVKDVKSS